MVKQPGMKLPRFSLRSLLIAVTVLSINAAIAKSFPKLAILMLWQGGIYLTFVIANRTSNVITRLSTFLCLIVLLVASTFWVASWIPSH